jgi:hypothetical protein
MVEVKAHDVLPPIPGVAPDTSQHPEKKASFIF